MNTEHTPKIAALKSAAALVRGEMDNFERALIATTSRRLRADAPWTAERVAGRPEAPFVIISARNTEVADIVSCDHSDEEISAHATLIAAAPDLLAALEGFLTTGYYPETIAAAKAAVDKARGE